MIGKRTLCALLAILYSPVIAAVAPAAAQAQTDANGNKLRRAPSGHVSNYDEAKVGTYTLPDPLVLLDGRPVRDADTWFAQRRPEILRLYETEIYGRVPERAPAANFEVVATDSQALDGAAVREEVVGHFGGQRNGPTVRVHLWRPARVHGPAPLVLHLTFTDGLAASITPGNSPAGRGPNRPPGYDAAPLPDLLDRGYAYATFRYTEVQGDDASAHEAGVQALAYGPGQTAPGPDEWGAIGAWAWGASRILDYFAADPAIDATRVALVGHSRLGMAVLWAAARDRRFALVFSSCSGEMGAALSRRDFGESVDDIAANFPWQFAGNFQKYIGHWNSLPVDAHFLIALCAPRPVFITGGTRDQWADPHGEFLAEVAAGPVYRLLGAKDLGTSNLPALDTPLLEGELGFNYHTGPHTITDAEWQDFLIFMERHLRSTR